MNSCSRIPTCWKIPLRNSSLPFSTTSGGRKQKKKNRHWHWKKRSRRKLLLMPEQRHHQLKVHRDSFTSSVISGISPIPKRWKIFYLTRDTKSCYRFLKAKKPSCAMSI